MQELHASFARWEQLREHGGQDPFWADGANMNLVRNHIIYYKQQLEELYPEGNYPDAYYRQTPPEMPANYMARADEIRANARKALEVYKQDKDYLFLKSIAGNLDAKTGKRLCVGNVLNYVSGLEHFIQTDDLVSMRRHERPETYLDAFVSCATRVRDLETPAQGSLFYLSADAPENTDDADEDEMDELQMSM